MLSDLIIARLAPDAKTYQIADLDGLYLRVNPKGVKTFFVEFRTGSKKVKQTLGTYPELSLTDARSKLQELKATHAHSLIMPYRLLMALLLRKCICASGICATIHGQKIPSYKTRV